MKRLARDKRKFREYIDTKLVTPRKAQPETLQV